MGWGAFANGIEACPIGLLMPDQRTIDDVIEQMRNKPVDAYIALNRAYDEVHLVQIANELNDRNA